MSKRKLFIVEDERNFAEMLKDFLSTKPLWDVQAFDSGEKCIKEAYQEPYAVIVDYNLDSTNHEAINGIETMKQFKKVSPKTHFMFLSAQEHYGVALKTVAVGADKYVIKNNDAFKEIGDYLDSI